MGWLSRIKGSLLSKIKKKIPKKDLESVEKTREEKNIKGKEIFFVWEVILRRNITAARPKTKAILAILEPITLPKVISVCPLMAAPKLTKSSGAEVAKDTIVIPTTRVDIFSFKARETAPLTKASPPK